MNSAHTVGPWMAQKGTGKWTVRAPRAPRQTWPYTSVVSHVGGDDKDREGNARLIAAAPDMFAILKAILAPDNAPLVLSDSHSLAIVEAAQRVVAKVEGVTE